MFDYDESCLSAPHSKRGALQREVIKLMREHEHDGAIPTSGRFLFYELEQRGVIPKKNLHIKRQPAQEVTEALIHLREVGVIPWNWITDVTREIVSWDFADSVLDYAASSVAHARIDLWAGEPPPLIICEARGVKSVLERMTARYLVPVTATAGQCGGFLATEVAPMLEGNDRRVAYIGDHELRGPAEQIEANTKRRLEEHAGREIDWERIALTEKQVNASKVLRESVIEKLDTRYKPPKMYRAVECEAIKQTVLVKLVQKWLDRQLPEPLEAVLVREDQERSEAHALISKWK